jgi:hypothetical protein
MRTNYIPKSREQSETHIIRESNDFAFGVRNDEPSSEITERGIYYLDNMDNKSTRLQTRCGTRRWGNYQESIASAEFPTIADDVVIDTTLLNGNRVVTLVSGYSFSVKDVGNFIIRDVSGKQVSEVILEVISTSEVTTRTELAQATTGETVSIGAPLNGIKSLTSINKVVVLVGSKVYLSSDVYMTEWNEIPFIGSDGNGSTPTDVTNAITQMEEFNDSVYLFNPNGVYRLI